MRTRTAAAREQGSEKERDKDVEAPHGNLPLQRRAKLFTVGKNRLRLGELI
jgi:hypothetical protein